MKLITYDAETYFSDDFTLKKLTTEHYVRDKRFKQHLFACKVDAGPTVWTNENPNWWLPRYAGADLEDCACLAHHAQFDGLILSHVYGIKPRMWFDTLSMARLVVPHEAKGLASLAKYFGLPEKNVPYQEFKNVRDLPPDLEARVGAGACGDVENTYAIFKHLLPYIPREELLIIDQTIRMFTEPVLFLDRELIENYHARVIAEKEALLTQLGVTRSDLQSNERFADLLRSLGVEPPKKKSQTTGEDIFAFAKTDVEMEDLEEHADTRVQALVAARLGVKSTIAETRSQRLLSMDERGPLCIYLAYASAHTHRWGGGDKLNFQNFPRTKVDEHGNKHGGEFRHSILAPEGCKIVNIDASQIECRILNHQAGQTDVLDMFRTGKDIYSIQASGFYGFEVTKAMKSHRGFGKQLELSCGYGAGAWSIQKTARIGQYGPPIYIDIHEAFRARDYYRNGHDKVVGNWHFAEQVVMPALRNKSQLTWGSVIVQDGRIGLPNGAWLWYDRWEERDGEWFCYQGRRWRKTYGAKIVQAVTQALARVVLSQAMIRIGARYRPVWCTHDDLTIVVPEDDKEALPFALAEMKRVPSWLEGCPLDAEGHEGFAYED